MCKYIRDFILNNKGVKASPPSHWPYYYYFFQALPIQIEYFIHFELKMIVVLSKFQF